MNKNYRHVHHWCIFKILNFKVVIPRDNKLLFCQRYKRTSSYLTHVSIIRSKTSNLDRDVSYVSRFRIEFIFLRTSISRQWDISRERIDAFLFICAITNPVPQKFWRGWVMPF